MREYLGLRYLGENRYRHEHLQYDCYLKIWLQVFSKNFFTSQGFRAASCKKLIEKISQ